MTTTQRLVRRVRVARLLRRDLGGPTSAPGRGAATRPAGCRPAEPLRPSRLLAGALLLTLASPAAAFGDALRCDGSLVSVGDTKLDLLGRCGPPALREREEKERTSVRVDEAGRTMAGRAVAVQVERWTYDFGPRQFIQHVRLEAGVITAVWHGGYGYGLGPPPAGATAIPRARCHQLAFQVGHATLDVLARCGEPATRDEKVVTETTAATGPGGAEVEAVTSSRVEEVWTYDLGPRTFTRRLTIDGGRVVRVDTGGYGYSR